MSVHRVTLRELADRHLPAAPMWPQPGQPTVVLVEPAGADTARVPSLVRPPDFALGAVIVALTSDDALWCTGPPWSDLAVPMDSPLLERVLANVDRSPIAATALAQLLRASEQRPMSDGLLLESALYSTLQASPEFARWLTTRPHRPPAAEPHPPLKLYRDEATLRITLARSAVRNALNSALRDALLEALQLALADATIEAVELRGEGSDFCSGGDLREFGSFTDPATAHLVRTALAIGPLFTALGSRLRVYVHGSCMGSGMELPAFAARVVARADSRFGLPELSLGLIPGAGGTWSIPRRIGRQRTALLALSGETIDARTALAIGLVDEVVDSFA